MPTYIPVERAEEIIHYYSCLQWQLWRGEIAKLCHPLAIKARELGMSLRTALNYVRYAKRIGMVESQKKTFRVY